MRDPGLERPRPREGVGSVDRGRSVAWAGPTVASGEGEEWRRVVEIPEDLECTRCRAEVLAAVLGETDGERHLLLHVVERSTLFDVCALQEEDGCRRTFDGDVIDYAVHVDSSISIGVREHGSSGHESKSMGDVFGCRLSQRQNDHPRVGLGRCVVHILLQTCPIKPYFWRRGQGGVDMLIYPCYAFEICPSPRPFPLLAFGGVAEGESAY